MVFKDINEMTNSSAWNKVREVNETDFTFDQVLDILYYVNNAASEDTDKDGLVGIILEAIDASC